MSNIAVEDWPTAVEVMFDRLESRLDRLDQMVDRIPWFILAAWVTLMLAIIGAVYVR